MAHNVTCDICHTDLPAYEAVIRSIALEQVAWHPDCYAGKPRVVAAPSSSMLLERLRGAA